jgi:hypothetical protein
MSKQAHKIYFWIVAFAFILTLSILYICNQDTIFGVVYPQGVKVEGDTLYGKDINVGGNAFTSGTLDWENCLMKYRVNR